MYSSIFCYRLAIERCKHNLAQLGAMTHLARDHHEEKMAVYNQTLQTLISALNRDLSLIEETLEALSPDENSEAA